MKKNLLERIKPEILQVINQDREKYPSSMENILSHLKDNFWVTDVHYGIAMDIMYNFKKAFKKQPESLWECFEEN